MNTSLPGETAPPPILPAWLPESVLEHVRRIDLGVEGAWSQSVRCVWTREGTAAGTLEGLPAGPGLRPSLELYMDGGWVGVHCARREGGVQVLDADLAREWIRLVAERARSD